MTESGAKSTDSLTYLAALQPLDEGLQRHSARVKRERRLQRQHLALSLACLALLVPLLLWPDLAQASGPWWLLGALSAVAAITFFRAAWALQQADQVWEESLVHLAVVVPPLFAAVWAWQMHGQLSPSALVLPFVLQPMLLLLAGLSIRRYGAAIAANGLCAATIILLSPATFLPCAAALLALALASALGLNIAQRLQHNQLRMWNMRQRVAEDAEKMAARNQKMRKLAFEDPLTGLSNRLDLINKLRQILKNPRDEAMNSVIYLIDLDFFKTVNDEYGHAAGDALLIEVGQRFKNIVRRGDLVCRLGGDEFVILLRGLNNHHEIIKIADKILATLAEPIRYQEQQLPLGGSVGIAPWMPDLRSPATWLALADQMMYQAKTAGRNRYMLADIDTVITAPAND